MPVKALGACTYPGCGKLVSGGRCDEHKAKGVSERKANIARYDKQRGTAASRGYDARWTAYSREYRKANPLCVDCLAVGRLTSVECGGHVDHIQPVTGLDDPMFWEPSNHASRCRPCHSAKTAREDGGFGNRGKR